MIDLINAKRVFDEYVNDFDKNNQKIVLKIEHTYRVMEAAKNVAISLNLTQDDIEIATLIGLLHDIGRFEQLKRYNCFIDSKTVDHALLGVQILFDDGLIDKFNIKQKDYQLIYKAIFNHNKYEVAKDLNEYELLHCKIIRDADKIDIFKTGLLETFEAFLDSNQCVLENDIISEQIYQTFMNNKSILSTTRRTDLDRWVSFLALIFDLNYQYSCNYVYQQDYITKLVKRLNYKNGDLVLTDDAIDNTVRGNVTFYDRTGYVVHIDMSLPFCPSLRLKLKESADLCGIDLIDKGIYICTNGPRFETPAEIKMYRNWGADMVGMTLFPEVTLSKEMGICYANISLVTNAAAGVEENRKLTSDEVIEEAKRNTLKISKIIEQYLKYDKREECNCKNILQGAEINKQV